MSDGKYKPEHMKKTQTEEWLDTFSNTTNFMKKVFLIGVGVCFVAVFIMFFMSRDHTTVADRDKAYLMSPTNTEEFTLETRDGIVKFSLTGMEKAECDSPGYARVFLTYRYRVTKGFVDVSKIAFAASYLGDSENPFGVQIVPIGAKNNNIADLKGVGEMEDYATGHLLIEIPESTGLVYSDIGGSASVSGRPAWLVYRVGDVLKNSELEVSK